MNVVFRVLNVVKGVANVKKALGVDKFSNGLTSVPKAKYYNNFDSLKQQLIRQKER